MLRGTPSWRIADIRPICRFGLSFRVQTPALIIERTINPALHPHFWEPSHSTTVILYKNDRSFWRYATLRRNLSSALFPVIRLSAEIACCNRAIHDDIIELSKRLWRADGEVFHHEPTAPCCHRFCGFRRPAATGDYPADCTEWHPGTNRFDP